MAEARDKQDVGSAFFGSEDIRFTHGEFVYTALVVAQAMNMMYTWANKEQFPSTYPTRGNSARWTKMRDALPVALTAGIHRRKCLPATLPDIEFDSKLLKWDQSRTSYFMNHIEADKVGSFAYTYFLGGRPAPVSSQLFDDLWSAELLPWAATDNTDDDDTHSD